MTGRSPGRKPAAAFGLQHARHGVRGRARCARHERALLERLLPPEGRLHGYHAVGGPHRQDAAIDNLELRDAGGGLIRAEHSLVMVNS